MKFLDALFVGQPLHILAVAVIFLAAHLLLRSTKFCEGCAHKQTLVAAVAWFFYAAWEWLVKVQTPEANIRVDLLLIWPILAILSVWAILCAMRKG